MTTLARDATPGQVYRLTREPGTTYYLICTQQQVRTLTKRVVGKNVRLLSADDRRLLQWLTKCQDEQHVLATRFLRFVTDAGERREVRAYVAFPPDYPLRAVAKPPGYGTNKKHVTPTASQGAETDGNDEESEEENDHGEAGGAGCQDTG